MTPCQSNPPCECAFHRAQLVAFAAWQEVMHDGIVQVDRRGYTGGVKGNAFR